MHGKAEDLTGLIIAGGLSRRFGTDKARQLIEERPMIEHVFEVLGAVTSRVLISIRPGMRPFDLPALHIEDVYQGAGPLAGLHAGLRAAEPGWVLAVGCDMPFLTPEVLHSLAAARTARAGAVVARTPDGCYQPLCACYHAGVRPVVEQLLRTSPRSMHALLRRLPDVRVVDLPEAPLRNVNTPADLDP